MTMSQREIAKAFAEAIRKREETPVQSASPASTYIALCYDDPVVKDNSSLLNLVSKDDHDNVQFRFPLSNSFVNGLLHCCSRVDDSVSSGFAEVAFQVLIRRPYELIADVSVSEMKGSSSSRTSLLNDFQRYIGNYQPTRINNNESIIQERDRDDMISNLSLKESIDSQIKNDPYELGDFNECEELIADESDDSYCDYGEDYSMHINSFNNFNGADPYDIKVLTKMPECPLTWTELQHTTIDLLRRVDYSHISALSNKRWREFGASKTLSDFCLLLINEMNKRDQKYVQKARPELIINNEMFAPLWSKFIFILRDRAIDESLKEDNNMDSLVALIILLKRLAMKGASSNERSVSINSPISVILICFASLCSSSLIRASTRKRTDIIKLIISLFPWLAKDVVGQTVNHSNRSSKTSISRHMSPICSIMEFLAGLDLSLDGSYDTRKALPEISSQLLSSGLFRELLMFHVEIEKSITSFSIRLLRSIFVLCALYPDLYNYASRVSLFTSLLETDHFLESHPADTVIWSLLAKQARGAGVSRKGSLRLIPVSKMGGKKAISSKSKQSDPDSLCLEAISIMFDHLVQLLAKKNTNQDDHINISLKDDFLFFVNTVSSSNIFIIQLQSISNPLLRSKLTEVKKMLMSWRPLEGDESDSNNTSNKNKEYGLSLVMVDSIRKSIKTLSCLLDDDRLVSKNMGNNNLKVKYQQSSKND